MLFGEWIATTGLTRADAAELLETTPATITYYCQGKHRPRAAMTARIYEVTGGNVSVADLHQAYQIARNDD